MWFVAAPFFKPNYCFLIKLYYSCFCCCCSVAKSCLTLWDPMDRSTPGFPVLHHLPKFSQTHVRLFCVSVSLSCHSAFFKKKKAPLKLHILHFFHFLEGSWSGYRRKGGSVTETSLEWAFWDSVQTLPPEAWGHILTSWMSCCMGCVIPLVKMDILYPGI